MIFEEDIHHMKSAISMAHRGVGRTAPNPSVGCVIVKNGIVISRSVTCDGGRPHAENIALTQADSRAKGAVMYVTLEPCAHHGGTSPCVDFIIRAGIKRVVIGVTDPDPRTSGKSIEKLRDAGVEVIDGVLEGECKDIHAGFISRITKNRPYITLKTACTLDGKIACASGESKWITGDHARYHSHYIRSRHDAVLIGVRTAIIDDPMLTTRISGLAHHGSRIVLDSSLRISPNSKLVCSARDIPLLVFTTIDESDSKYKALKESGVILYKIDPRDLRSVLTALAEYGINRLLVEGGGKTHASFLRSKLCDELVIYRAPTLLGVAAISAIDDLSIETLAQRHDFSLYSTLNVGFDVLEIYKNKYKSS